MEYMLIRVAEFLEAIGVQLASLFGIFFIFGYALSQIETWTQEKYRRAVGWKGILWTAWIGTPVHELGHAIMALLFRHRILHVALFAPNKNTGELGVVDHSYNPKSWYQTTGNFFIGAAPLLFGSLALSSLLYFMTPNGAKIIESFGTFHATLRGMSNELLLLFHRVFHPANMNRRSFWILLYISFCISSHLAPSSEDLRSMRSGLVRIILLLVLVNAVALLFHWNILRTIDSIAMHLTVLTALLLYAFFVSVCHFILSFVVWSLVRRTDHHP